ncbi:MAG: hypothetical protein H0W68_00765 [Gemmatimonadaceae bacterium]|nr:hypothetical protein [Gemmatimonadaceae bacterium]
MPVALGDEIVALGAGGRGRNRARKRIDRRHVEAVIAAQQLTHCCLVRPVIWSHGLQLAKRPLRLATRPNVLVVEDSELVAVRPRAHLGDHARKRVDRRRMLADIGAQQIARRRGRVRRDLVAQSCVVGRIVIV